MGKRTSLYDCHLKSNAKIVDFAGWDMPLHYGSQLQEHHQVRQHAGVFDVSHMGIVDIQGRQAASYLRYLLANNIDRLMPNKALYSCMLNEAGGVIDDLIVYKISDQHFRLVINAGTREKDLAWMKAQAKAYEIQVIEAVGLAMLALQGPEAKKNISVLFSPEEITRIHDLKPFSFLVLDSIFIARTGYTGEDGYEIILPASEAPKHWEKLLNAGIAPCGLGARDTLRLEAGFNLYGSDMDETVTPLESNLAWTVSMESQERKFIGRDALEKQSQNGVKRQLAGLILDGSGIMRNHQKIWIDKLEAGEITSGGFSPTLGKSIAFARIPMEINTTCFVEIRNKILPVHVIKLPFVRHGKKMF